MTMGGVVGRNMFTGDKTVSIKHEQLQQVVFALCSMTVVHIIWQSSGRALRMHHNKLRTRVGGSRLES